MEEYLFKTIKKIIMYNNFSEGVTYDFSEEDYLFIRELSKIGFVNLSSSQVSFIDKNAGTKHDHNISFKKNGIGDSQKCLGLKTPDNWVIEYISANEERIYITFGIIKNKKNAN